MPQDIEYTVPKIMTVSEFGSLNLGIPAKVNATERHKILATQYD